MLSVSLTQKVSLFQINIGCAHHHRRRPAPLRFVRALTRDAVNLDRDGGNREGAYDSWLAGEEEGAEKPVWSAFRKGEFGHGKLVLQNATHALWTWHKTHLGEKVISDQVWIERVDATTEGHEDAEASLTKWGAGAPSATGLGGQVGSPMREGAAAPAAGVPTAKGLRSE